MVEGGSKEDTLEGWSPTQGEQHLRTRVQSIRTVLATAVEKGWACLGYESPVISQAGSLAISQEDYTRRLIVKYGRDLSLVHRKEKSLDEEAKRRFKQLSAAQCNQRI